MAKKLKVEDIPEGYNYAAVDSDGFGWAYKDMPQLNEDDGYWCFTLCDDALRLGNGYDSTDWQNSLMFKECNEVKAEPRKLHIYHIPRDLNWAAVDKDGSAWAFKQKPKINKETQTWVPEIPEYLFEIGNNFDATNWENSLVSRETAERPELKKLTAADIPEGYRYAAVDEDREAFAYQERPLIIVTCWKGTCRNPKFLGNNFDASDWANSLVSRETAESESAYKETKNKLSYSEIDPYFLEQMARRMQKGKEKYGPNNWKKLSDINELLDAAQRHLLELRKMVQEDFEPLSGQESEAQHCAALACNAMFIHYHLNPNS